MTKNGTVSINILGDSKDAQKAFRDVEHAGSKMGDHFTKIGKSLATGLAVGVGAAAAGLGALVAGGVKDLINLEKIGAQTANVIKSTGGAANVSAVQVGKMAESIERMTGIEQEGIREGANLLLTFTNIQNKAGKGNDIFNQSTKILTDMSVALGTDAKSSAIQLGKALNDPIKGVAALTKVGVSFTAQQKEQIKAMVAVGDTAGAQRVILAELNKEFGGSAEAFGNTAAGAIAKFKNSLGDVGEELATKFMPLGEKLLGWASDLLPKALDVARTGVGRLQENVVAVADQFRNNFFQALEHGSASVFPEGARSASALDVVIGRLAQAAAFVKQRWDEMYPSLVKAGNFVRDIAIAAFERLKQAFIDNKEQLHVLADALKYLLPVAVVALGAAIAIGAGILQAFIVTIGSVVRAVQWLATTAGEASVKLPMMWEAFKESFKNAINWIIRKWNGLEFRAPSLPGFPSVTIGVPDIPMLAKGGIVSSPTLAMIGEAGPEAVVPLSRGGAGAGVGSTVIHVHVAGSVVSEHDLVDTVRRGLLAHQRRNGTLGFA